MVHYKCIISSSQRSYPQNLNALGIILWGHVATDVNAKMNESYRRGGFGLPTICVD